MIARARCGALAACIVAAMATATMRSATADDVVAVQFDYEARPGCPDADAFVREVLARAPRARVANAAERARTLVARIRTSGRELEGALVVRDVDGATTERTVHAQSCGELVTALAVIAAIVIDPITAKSGELDAADAGPPPAAPVVPSPEPPVTPPPVSVPEGTTAWTFSAGAGGGLVGGASPTVLLSVPVFLEASRQVSGVVEPAARLRFERTSLGSTTGSAGGASFVLTSGAADVCPIALRARSFRIQPCARAELGALTARGRGVEPTRSDTRPWFALGPVARARLEIAGPVFAELEAALLASFIRDRFYVEPATLIYRPPALGGTTAFAVGVAF